MLKKAFSFLLFIAISIYSASGIFCYATEDTLLPEISEDSDFTDDRIIVVLDNETSINFKEYDSTDFSKINCKQVRICPQNPVRLLRMVCKILRVM